jgi:hypothetical protein
VVIKAAILFSPSFLPFFLCCEIGWRKKKQST